MSTLGKIVYNFKNLQNSGTHTDDLALGDRQLEFIMNHFRAEIAAQRVNDKKSTDGFNQEIGNLKLVATKDFRPSDPSIKVFKSASKIPGMVSSHNRGEVIDYVGFRDTFLGFQKTTMGLFNIDLTNSMNTELFFTAGDYLYVLSKRGMLSREIFMSGVFTDPREVKLFTGELTTSDALDWDYPFPDNLIGQLNNLAINNEFRWTQALPKDTLNDGKDGQ